MNRSTTITFPPTPELKKAFPPATNQHGESVWPVAMLMVASEMATGCVLVPEVGAMYGDNSSEAALAERVIDRLAADSLVLADSGFGIFRVAHHCELNDKEFVFRLTASRFKALKSSTPISVDAEARDFRVEISERPESELASVLHACCMPTQLARCCSQAESRPQWSGWQ